MALIHEVPLSPKKQYMPYCSPHGFVTLSIKDQKLSNWIYPYTENHDAKNAITGGTRMMECLTGDLIYTV